MRAAKANQHNTPIDVMGHEMVEPKSVAELEMGKRIDSGLMRETTLVRME
jgi:hypothetical protein